MSLEDICLFLEEFSRSPVIQLVIAFATIWAVLVAARSARLAARANREAAKIGEESVRIGKQNTEYNERLLLQSEKQHRLGVKPLLATLINRRTPKAAYYELDYVVQNLGVGPAIIKKLEFFLDGRPFDYADYGEIPVDLIRICYPDEKTRPEVGAYAMPGIGAAVLAGGAHKFITLRYYFASQPTKKQMSEVEEFLSRPRIRIIYTSIYGDEDFSWESGPVSEDLAGTRA